VSVRCPGRYGGVDPLGHHTLEAEPAGGVPNSWAVVVYVVQPPRALELVEPEPFEGLAPLRPWSMADRPSVEGEEVEHDERHGGYSRLVPTPVEACRQQLE
jgi:hypothetical protein